MSLRLRLQRETQAHHRALDELVTKLGCFESLHNYGNWLSGMHAFHVKIRDSFAATEVADPLQTHRAGQRVQLLARDIEDLGTSLRRLEEDETLGILDHDALLGVVYVVEGASLGARMLVRLVGKLGVTAALGARYLSSEAESMASWNAVAAQLTEIELDEAATRKAISAAQSTFDLAAWCLGGQHCRLGVAFGRDDASHVSHRHG